MQESYYYTTNTTNTTNTNNTNNTNNTINTNDPSPYTKAKVAGELHVVGFPTSYDGMLYIEREGFIKAEVTIKNGSKKSYHIADLTQEEGAKDALKGKLGSLWQK